MRIAAGLGADVPFFLVGGTALATGRGERLDPLPDPLPRWLVLVIPDDLVRDKTRTIYRMLEPKWHTGGGFALNLAQRLRTDPVATWRPLGNGLEPTAVQAFPGLRAARDALTRATETAWQEFPTAAGEDAKPELEPFRRGPGRVQLLRRAVRRRALPRAARGAGLQGSSPRPSRAALARRPSASWRPPLSRRCLSHGAGATIEAPHKKPTYAECTRLNDRPGVSRPPSRSVVASGNLGKTAPILVIVA